MKWLTQFICAMKGTHAVSQEVEDEMFKHFGKKITVYCKWCGHSLNVEILNDTEYRLRWDKY
jgi:transcription elongation factor Elf1